MGDSTLTVQQAYRDAGLRLEPELREPPDHIAVELEFLAYLTNRAVEATRGGELQEANRFLAARGDFLDDQVRPWVPPFTANMKAGTESPFYQHLADCLARFIAVDPHPRP
jgi:TorA maturation chaperone TorD